MNTQKDNEDEGYDKNDFIDNDDTVKNQVVAKKDKAAKAKRTKHKYIPRVWFEGKKMIIRGKAKLQLSNEEIHLKMRDKDKKNQLDRDNEATNNAVRIGKQSTLSNFVMVKQTKIPATKNVSVKTVSAKDRDLVYDSSDNDGKSSTDSNENDCENYTYLQKDTPKENSSSDKQTSIINYATVTKNENAQQEDSIKVSTRPESDNKSQAMDSSVGKEKEEYVSENCPEIAYFMQHCEVKVPEWMKNEHSSHDEDEE